MGIDEMYVCSVYELAHQKLSRDNKTVVFGERETKTKKLKKKTKTKKNKETTTVNTIHAAH